MHLNVAVVVTGGLSMLIDAVSCALRRLRVADRPMRLPTSDARMAAPAEPACAWPRFRRVGLVCRASWGCNMGWALALPDGGGVGSAGPLCGGASASRVLSAHP